MNEPWWSAEAKRRFELQSYEPRPTIDGVEFVELTRHADDGGSMTELLRLDGSIRRVSATSAFARSTTTARSSPA